MLKNKKLKTKCMRKAGMISLFPAIIISSILLIMLVDASNTFLSGLWRNTLIEKKMQSDVLVQSCLRLAVSKIIQNPSYAGGETLHVVGYKCVVKTIVGQKIEVSVSVGGAQSTDTALYNNSTQTFLEFL